MRKVLRIHYQNPITESCHELGSSQFRKKAFYGSESEYPRSEVPLQRKRRIDSLVACSKAFQMIGPIELSHSTSGI